MELKERHNFVLWAAILLLFDTANCQTGLTAVDPCDGCLWKNGIGFAAGPECWQYYQCVVESSQVIPILMSTAFGTFWDNSRLSQREPGPEWDCPVDRCRDLPRGALYGRSDNCRIFMQCRADVAETLFIGCCPDGTGFLEGQGCVIDPACTDTCKPETADEECSLKPVENSDILFELGDQIMTCSVGTRFDVDQCACVLDQAGMTRLLDMGQVCEPDLDLVFDAAGVRDVSRNKFPVTNVRVTTRNDPNRGHVGVFDNGYLRVEGLANRDMTNSFAIYMQVRPIDFNHQNEVIVSNSDCVADQETYAVVIDSPFGFPEIRGMSRTVPDILSDTEPMLLPPDRFSEVVYEFNGAALTIYTNDGLGPVETVNFNVGPLMSLQQPSCAMMIGDGASFAPFRGEIAKFRVFTCIRTNLEDYFN